MALKFNALTGNLDIVLDKASEIIYDPSADVIVTADNVQDAIEQLDDAVSTLPNPIYYAGTWNASTNTPTLLNTDVGAVGRLYRVTVAGTTDFGAGPISFTIGDSVVNNGTFWERWDQSDAVISVNGQTDAVVLDTDDIAEGANQYFTDERAQDAVGTILTDTATIDFSYNDGGNSISAVVAPNSISDTHVATGAGIDAQKIGAGSVDNTELGYVNGVTSPIQAQFSGKQDTITGAATTITTANLTANRAVQSSATGKIEVSATTSTELGYVNGVTSAIQTQLNDKQTLLQTLAVSSDVTLTASRVHLVDTSAARALTLPAVVNNLILHVKDASGSSETNNITITPASGTIDGAASLVINSAYASVYLISNGTNWFSI